MDFIGSWHCAGCGAYLRGGPFSREYRYGHPVPIMEAHGVAVVACGPVFWDGPAEELAEIEAHTGAPGKNSDTPATRRSSGE